MSEFTGIWLPAEILAIQGLNLTEKVLAAQVLMLSRSGECRAQNPHLAAQLGMTTTTISQTLQALSRKGYIVIDDGKEQGNKRQMYPSLKLLHSLCKNLTEGWEKINTASVKILKSLYKILTEAIQDSYTPYVKILHSLFKNLTELYIRNESKDESKRERRFLTGVAIATDPFWSVLLLSFSDYTIWLTAETKKREKPPVAPPPQFPPGWTQDMVSLYLDRWLPFRQKQRKKLLPVSIQEQINQAADLTEPELAACIQNSISNGYQGLFPDKFKTRNGNPKNAKPDDNAFGQGAILPSGAAYRKQSIGRRVVTASSNQDPNA